MDQQPHGATDRVTRSNARIRSAQSCSSPAHSPPVSDAAAPAAAPAASSVAKGKRKASQSDPLPEASSSSSSRPHRVQAHVNSTTQSQPSAKSLGKRRAVSPPPPDTSATSQAESSRPSKKQKKETSTTERSYNLRPRPSISNSNSLPKMPRKSKTAANKNKAAASSPEVPGPAASSSRSHQADPDPIKPEDGSAIQDIDSNMITDAAEASHPMGDHESHHSDEDVGNNDDMDEDHSHHSDEDDDEVEHPYGGDEDDEEAAEQANQSRAALLNSFGLEGLMNGISSRLRQMLQGLRSKGDPSIKLITLQDLSELLSMSTEDTLAGYFQIESFSRELVTILRGTESAQAYDEDGEDIPMDFGGEVSEEANVEMMLLACRCLANMIEALPGSSHPIVQAGAVPVLCAKLFEIQYIDLAEQTLSTLEKISKEMPASIVEAGGLSAILTYLDFFSTNVQRTAMTTTANCCRNISTDSYERVKEVMPTIRNILSNPDQRVVEQACLAVTRIIESFRNRPEKLTELCTPELLAAITTLLVPGGVASNMSEATYTQILKMIATASKGSGEVAASLVEMNIANTIYQILTGITVPSETDGYEGIKRQRDEDDTLVLQNLAHRPKDQINETLNVIIELLPSLPRDGVFDPKSYFGRKKVKKEEGSPALHNNTNNANSLPRATLADDGTIIKSEENSPALNNRNVREIAIEQRLDLLNNASEQRSERLARFYALMLPTLLDVYAASASMVAKTKAVSGMLKMINFCDSTILAQIMHLIPMASFLGGILTSTDQPALVTSALQMVELLLNKMPDTYQYFFRREGVVYEITRIAGEALLTPSKSRKSKSSRGGDPNGTSGTSTPIEGSSADHMAMPIPIVSVPISSKQSNDWAVHDTNVYRARHIKEKLTTNAGEAVHKAQTSLERIKLLAERLKSANQNDDVDETLKEIGAIFTQDDAMSSFELLESGLIDSLLRYALALDQDRSVVTARQQKLASALFVQRGAVAAFPLLVKRLQESLSRLENFEVISALSGTDDVKRSSTSMLARQMRVRLRAEGEGIPASCQHVNISIHAIATFQALNDYLKSKMLAEASPGQSANARVQGILAALSAAADGTGSEAATSAAINSLMDRLAGGNSALPSPGSLPAINTQPASPRPAPVPARRRSSRLSEKLKQSAGEPDASTTTEAEASTSTQADTGAGHVAEPEDDEEIDEEELLGEANLSVEERPVNVRMASDGSHLEASTPTGTRIATPAPGSAAPSTNRPAASASAAPTRSYASALKFDGPEWHLEFFMGGERLTLDTTIYGAVHHHQLSQNPGQQNMIWSRDHEVTYKKVTGAQSSPQGSPAPPARDELSPAFVPESVSKESQQAKILQLLRVLYSINSTWADRISFDSDASHGSSSPLVPAAFVNSKLTAKLNRQLEEPMILASSCLPEWSLDLPQFFPFLFPFESRYSFMQSTSFGYARLMAKWLQASRQESNRRDDTLYHLGKLQRQKVRISRSRLVESAFKVFELYGCSRAMLEVEYFEEVGTGLGPTLEFYNLVSKELSRKSFNLWRDGNAGSDSEYVFNSEGLFPAPMHEKTLDTEAGRKRINFFKMMGTFLAKALMDSRIVDLAFNKLFMSLVQDQDIPLTIASVKVVDPALAQSLQMLQRFADAKAEAIKASQPLEGITVDETDIEDMSLYFTLPGYDLELKEGGADIPVTIENVDEFINLVIDTTLSKGVQPLVASFKAGFDTVFPVRDLRGFTPEELVSLFGNDDADWSEATLLDSIKADHGYSSASNTFAQLVQIMSAMTSDEKRTFLSFCTGSARLPIGGFASLNPRMTVVKKVCPSGELPSVMTCSNYLKLPDYNDKEVLKERLYRAMQEGGQSFHLS